MDWPSRSSGARTSCATSAQADGRRTLLIWTCSKGRAVRGRDRPAAVALGLEAARRWPWNPLPRPADLVEIVDEQHWHGAHAVEPCRFAPKEEHARHGVAGEERVPLRDVRGRIEEALDRQPALIEVGHERAAVLDPHHAASIEGRQDPR